MKKLILPIFAMLFGALLLAVIPTEAEAAIYEDTIRLHILAPSDSEEDQKLKLEIRDEILKRYGAELKSAEDACDARDKIEALLPEIETVVKEETKKRGYEINVKANLSREWYDTREYESFTLPKGEYLSLRIILGEGEGKNWWCVMFPPLCLDVACEKAPADDAVQGLSKEETILISQKQYNAKFKILEILSGAFSGKY